MAIRIYMSLSALYIGSLYKLQSSPKTTSNTYAHSAFPLQCWDVIAKLRGFNNITKEREKTKGAELSKEIVSQFHFPIACSVLSVFRHFFVPPPTSPQWWNSPLPVAPRSYRLGCWLSHTLALSALPMYLVKVDHCPALPYKKTWKDNGRDSVIKKHPRWRSQ